MTRKASSSERSAGFFSHGARETARCTRSGRFGEGRGEGIRGGFRRFRRGRFDGDDQFIRLGEVLEEKREAFHLRQVRGQELEDVDVEADVRQPRAGERQQRDDDADPAKPGLNRHSARRCSRIAERYRAGSRGF